MGLISSEDSDPLEQFQELKEKFQNLEEQRKEFLEKQADRLLTGLKIEEIAREAFGSNSQEYEVFLENMRETDINPRQVMAKTGRRESDKGLNDLENKLEEKEEVKKATLSKKTRQIYNTTETTLSATVELEDGESFTFRR